MVGNRLSAKSIMIGTLFHLLQDALACGGFNADPTLARIIKQDPDIASTISIATTRVPDFGEQISNPSHGFRSLCGLPMVTPQLQDISHTFHPSYELLASKTQTDNPVAICFAESFQPMGINLASHFNIIFYPIHVSSIPSLWGRGTSTSAESSVSPWDSIRAVQSRNSSESPQVDVASLFQSNSSQPRISPHDISSLSCDAALPHISQSSSPIDSASADASAKIPSSYLPASSPQHQPHPELQLQLLASVLSHENASLSCDFARPHISGLLAPQSLQPQRLTPSPSFPPPVGLLSPQLQSQQPQSLSPPPITLHCSVSESNSNESSTLEFQSHPPESESISTSSSCLTIPCLLKKFSITDEQKEATIYKRSFKGLYLKVRNFNAMNFILENMGYTLPFRITADPTIKNLNVTVKASEVLQHFGWAPTSFEHKTLWYGTAKTLSQRRWKAVPSKSLIVCWYKFIDDVYIHCSTGYS